jgi:hypothetical protein
VDKVVHWDARAAALDADLRHDPYVSWLLGNEPQSITAMAAWTEPLDFRRASIGAVLQQIRRSLARQRYEARPIPNAEPSEPVAEPGALRDIWGPTAEEWKNIPMKGIGL